MYNDIYQRIRDQIVTACGKESKVLLYAEVQSMVISADLHFQVHGAPLVQFQFASDSLRDLIYDFWETGNDTIAPRSWFALKFVVSGGGFTAQLTAPDQVNLEEDVSDRRPAVVENCFPGLMIDYPGLHV